MCCFNAFHVFLILFTTLLSHIFVPAPSQDMEFQRHMSWFRSSCSKPGHGVPTSYAVVSFILLQARTWSSNVICRGLVHPAPSQDMEFQRHMPWSRSSCSKPGHGVPTSYVVVSFILLQARTWSSNVICRGLVHPAPSQDLEFQRHMSWSRSSCSKPGHGDPTSCVVVSFILLQARTWSSNVICRGLVHPAPSQDMEFQRHVSWSRSWSMS